MKAESLDQRLAVLEASHRPRKDTWLSQLTIEELRQLGSIAEKKEAGIEAIPEEMAFCDCSEGQISEAR
jgi:sugar phosphate isomerase/epimerase